MGDDKDEDFDGSGGSSLSKLAFSFSIDVGVITYAGKFDGMWEGSSSSKVAFSFDGIGGDGRVLRRGPSSS